MNIEPLQSIMLAIAQARSVDTILKEIVGGLTECSNSALVRIWLVAPGDICARCHFREECPDRSRCLHLVASAGWSRESGKEYTYLDGKFRRIPLGVRKVGRVAATGEPFLIPEVTPEHAWVSDPIWIGAEGVQSFAGQR